MLPSNFMLRDVVGSIVALIAFTCVLFAPGYLVAFCTNIFGFRSSLFAPRARWAIALSFCVSPISAYLVGKVFGLTGVCWFFAISGLLAAPLLFLPGTFTGWEARDRRATALVVAGWTALVLLLLVDFQVGHKLYYSVVMADQSYRIAFTDAVVRTGVPPANPLYFAGSTAPMHYYYFWYILCAAVVKIAHVSARQAFIASSIWAGFGLVAAVHLYASDFFHWSRKTAWIATGLLLVTGADLLPALGNLVLQSSVNGSSEWWSVDPIDAWPDSLLWVPHHVASVLCCLFAFLLIWRAMRASSQSHRLAVVCFAACASASAFGLSTYVAVGFAIMMALCLTRAVIRRDTSSKAWFRWLIATALLTAAFLAPFLPEIFGSSPGIGASATQSKRLLWFSVRPMIDSGLITSLPLFSGANKAHPVLLEQAVRLVLLLPGLAMELGLYGAVLVFLVNDRRRKRTVPWSESTRAGFFLTITGLLMTMFVSSSIITNNDFGYRAVMLPQFFLSMLTAQVISEWWKSSLETNILASSPVRRRFTIGLLFLGIAGSCYWAVLLRAWLPIVAAQPQSSFAKSPQDEFEVRDAFERLRLVAAPNSVLAFRDMDLDAERKDMEVMTPTEYFQRMLVMDAGMQILNAERKCATHFGGDPGPCSKMKAETEKLYASPAPSRAQAEEYCRRRGVQYLALSVRDAPWTSQTGWPTELTVVAYEPRFKILQCSPAFSLPN